MLQCIFLVLKPMVKPKQKSAIFTVMLPEAKTKPGTHDLVNPYKASAPHLKCMLITCTGWFTCYQKIILYIVSPFLHYLQILCETVFFVCPESSRCGLLDQLWREDLVSRKI